MKKIAIIGGSGFIATNLIGLLKGRPLKISIFDIVEPEQQADNCVFVHMDIRDPGTDFSVLSDFDYIYLFAALLGKRCKEEPDNGWRTNILGLNNLIHQLVISGKQPVLIFTSSCMVYDTAIESVPIAENSPLKGKELYSISKIFGESLIHSCCQAYGFKGIVFRFFTVYGPGPASAGKGHFIPTWIERSVSNEPLTIFGDGEQTIDLTHVADVVSALSLVLDLDLAPGYFEIFNISSGAEVKVKDIAAWFQQVKPGIALHYNPAANSFARRKVGNIAKAGEMLNYAPRIDPRDGLIALLKEKLC